MGAAGKPIDDKSGTDFDAIAQNKISISPVDYDLTNKEILQKLKKNDLAPIGEENSTNFRQDEQSRNYLVNNF